MAPTHCKEDGSREDAKGKALHAAPSIVDHEGAGGVTADRSSTV
jgi:hypothetical protein